MRQITMIGIVAATALLVPACGGSAGTFANKPRPPEPITITGQVNNARVLISPASFGAGPINLIVTNFASRSVSLAVRDASGRPVANLQSINPQTPGDVKFDIAPGDYAVIASQAGIKPAELHVGKERPSAGNGVLQP
ncbi:MAG TPA: hypothetical protein VG295_09995 [Solirubrobacteraceae bacterium]|nr:hypothetical protein [Solirubrobacteraceae bacterium]